MIKHPEVLPPDTNPAVATKLILDRGVLPVRDGGKLAH
jgi:hypothetical protein